MIIISKYLETKIKKDIREIKKLKREGLPEWCEPHEFDNENYKKGYLDARNAGIDAHIEHLEYSLKDILKYFKNQSIFGYKLFEDE